MAKLVVLIHGLMTLNCLSEWGEIICLGVIFMHVLNTLTCVLSPGASSSSAWLQPTALPGTCGCPAPAPASPHTHQHKLFTAHWLLWCSLSLCRQMALGRTCHPPVSPQDAALYSGYTPTCCCLCWQPFKELSKDKTPKIQEIILKRKVPFPLI